MLDLHVVIDYIPPYHVLIKHDGIKQPILNIGQLSPNLLLILLLFSIF